MRETGNKDANQLKWIRLGDAILGFKWLATMGDCVNRQVSPIGNASMLDWSCSLVWELDQTIGRTQLEVLGCSASIS